MWIRVASDDHFNAQLATLEQRRLSDGALPLLGQTFALKDNIDAVGFSTTAGCPAYAYKPAEDATIAARLKAAGAILLGKTNSGSIRHRPGRYPLTARSLPKFVQSRIYFRRLQFRLGGGGGAR